MKVDKYTELRILEPAFAEDIGALVFESFERLRRWLPWVNDAYTVEVTRRFILLAEKQFREKTGMQTAVFYKGELAGGIGFNALDNANRSAEIGYWLGGRFVGKGIMTSCCRALVEFGFEEFGLNRIVIRCATENQKSQAIPIRLGFKVEGVQREAERLNEEFVDLRVYSLIAADLE